jgi:N-ethylmaleimide reductase
MNKDRQQVPYETPRAIELGEIPGIVAAYAQGARNALAAGFDGVEVHGANGYLLQQFLETKTNLRTDAYGGSIENRFRLMREVVTEVVKVWSADRVGIRLSPFASVNDSGEADPQTLYTYVLSELAKFDLAYVHLIEARDATGENPHTPQFDALRKLWPNALIAASGFKPESALAAVQAGRADAVAFGRWFIANPDLPERIKRGAPLNPYDRTTFYGGTEKGYTDYPALEASPA